MFECDSKFDRVYLKNNTVPKAGTCAGGAGETAQWRIVQGLCSKASLGFIHFSFQSLK